MLDLFWSYVMYSKQRQNNSNTYTYNIRIDGMKQKPTLDQTTNKILILLDGYNFTEVHKILAKISSKTEFVYPLEDNL